MRVEEHQSELQSSENSDDPFDLKDFVLGVTLTLSTFGGVACAPNPAPTPTVPHQPAITRTIRREEIPDSFKMEEQLFSFGTDMDLVDHDGSLGKIEQRTLNFGRTFEYFDASGVKQASAKERVFSWGVHIDVYDQNDQKIGGIKEEIFESMFSIKSQYSVLDQEDNLIAKSEKLDFIGTDVKIKDRDGTVIATMDRPAINFLGDSWNVTFASQGKIDRRLLMFIPSYKTAADNARTGE